MMTIRICIAACVIAIGTILIPVSLIYGKGKPLTAAQKKAKEACWTKLNSCWDDCAAKAASFPKRWCYENCVSSYSFCMDQAGIHNAPIPPRVHTPEKATPGQKVESTPKPTPRDKAPSGKVLEQSSPTPKPTPSLKKKGNIQKQGM
jgi:hypothetical protein